MGDWLSLVFFSLFYMGFFKDKRPRRRSWLAWALYGVIVLIVWSAVNEVEGWFMEAVPRSVLRRSDWFYVDPHWTTWGRVILAAYHGITLGMKNWLAWFTLRLCIAYDRSPLTRTRWYKPVPGKTVGRDVVLARASESTSFAPETITPSPPHPSEPVVDPKP